MSVEPTAVTAREEFLALLDTSVVQNTLVKLLLSKYQGEETELQRLTIRPVTVKGQACLSFVSTYKTRDITKNLPVAEALAHIASLLPAAFRNAHLLSLSNLNEPPLRLAEDLAPLPPVMAGDTLSLSGL